MPGVDTNEVMMTGENSFIRLSEDGGATLSSRLSHWRVLWCPAGAGHVLFIQSDLTDDQVRIYSDNVAVARWLQREIETYLFAEFADPTTPVVAADFMRDGDPRSAVTETIVGASETIIMTWHDCIDSFVISNPPGTPPERPIGVFSTMFPAREAQVEIDGRLAAGSPWPQMRDERQTSSCCLAWSETWTKPID